MTQRCRFDRDVGEFVPCGSRTVVCKTEGCFNFGLPIEVADDPHGLLCGPCGALLA